MHLISLSVCLSVYVSVYVACLLYSHPAVCAVVFVTTSVTCEAG